MALLVLVPFKKSPCLKCPEVRVAYDADFGYGIKIRLSCKIQS